MLKPPKFVTFEVKDVKTCVCVSALRVKLYRFQDINEVFTVGNLELGLFLTKPYTKISVQGR